MAFNSKKFFDSVRRSLFGSHLTQDQVDGINTLLRVTQRLPVKYAAYILATAYHETARTMQPITEYGSRKYFDKYDTGRLANALGNTPEADGDGYFYRGRGYVQITGKANYKKAGDILGVDLVHYPDFALDPDIAAAIIVRGCMEGWFTGKKLTDYAGYYSMRRVVNGLDSAYTIAEYANRFEEAYNAANS